jgi:hypothetical protein
MFTVEAQRTQKNLFFIKSGDADFMKDPAATGGVRVRVATSLFPLAASPAKGKNMVLCILGVSAVNRPFKRCSFKRLNRYKK